MADTNVLDLTIDEIVEDRPKVKLPDGKDYEMRLPGEFGIERGIRMQRVLAQMQKVTDGEGEDLSDEEASSLKRSMDRYIAILLPDASEEVRNQLNDVQQMRIVNYFNSFIPAARESETQSDSPPTSPDSNGSTAEPPKAG